MSRGTLKISKSDISNPIAVAHVATFRPGQANPTAPQSPSAFQDSAIALHPEPAHAGPAIAAFSSARFDTSASIAGSPLDPRMQNKEPPKMSSQQFQNFIQAVGAFRRQLVAMGLAAEMFVRNLEDLSEFVPAADIKKPHIIGDLDFLIDSTHLIANSHQIWADTLEREFEIPLTQRAQENNEIAKKTAEENKVHIAKTVELLHQEEDASYKMGKQKKRDLDQLQRSLQVRTHLADKIKNLQRENILIHDTLAHKSMEFILEKCAHGVRAELETYDRIMEGLKKLGAYQPEPDTPDVTFSTARLRSSIAIPSQPPTEILPPIPRISSPTGQARSPQKLGQQKTGTINRPGRAAGELRKEKEEDDDLQFLRSAWDNL